MTNNLAEVAEAIHRYFIDSVVTTAQCFFP